MKLFAVTKPRQDAIGFAFLMTDFLYIEDNEWQVNYDWIYQPQLWVVAVSKN